jgi:hypothetical protein
MEKKKEKEDIDLKIIDELKDLVSESDLLSDLHDLYYNFVELVMSVKNDVIFWDYEEKLKFLREMTETVEEIAENCMYIPIPLKVRDPFILNLKMILKELRRDLYNKEIMLCDFFMDIWKIVIAHPKQQDIRNWEREAETIEKLRSILLIIKEWDDEHKSNNKE